MKYSLKKECINKKYESNSGKYPMRSANHFHLIDEKYIYQKIHFIILLHICSL